MAGKRTAECMENLEVSVNKYFNFSQEDLLFGSTDISKDVKCSLEYDNVLSVFVIRVEKHRPEGNRVITFDADTLGNIILVIPAIDQLVERCASKRSPRPLDIPFQVDTGNIGDLVTVVSLKESAYKRGEFHLDVRNCFKREDSQYRYTSEGVRINQESISAFGETLKLYHSLIRKVKSYTKDVVIMTAAHLIRNEITRLATPAQNCYGCQINHPSQKQHMGDGGCLATDQQSWEDSCDMYFQVAKSRITDERVQGLAKAAMAVVPEMKVKIQSKFKKVEEINIKQFSLYRKFKIFMSYV